MNAAGHIGLIDTHCHLQHEAFDADREEVRSRALEVLEWLVVIGDALNSSRRAVAMSGPQVYAATGFHPYHAAEVNDETLSALETLSAADGVVAIGEIGLDYHNVVSPPEVQARAFRSQLELAARAELPVIIHNRDAHADVLTILREFQGKLRGGIMHCFSGNLDFARDTLALGFHISFAGNLTFPKARELREVAHHVPLDRLLVETDSPYLAPQPRRGKRCEPAFVQYTAETLAALKDAEFEDVARHTTANARALFKVPAPV